MVASCLPASLPEQLLSLAKTGNISPELLASIPHLSMTVASRAAYGTSSMSNQALAHVLSQSMAHGVSCDLAIVFSSL